MGGRTLGALCVVRPQIPFDTDETRALTLLANAAAVALENARLYRETQQRVDELTTLTMISQAITSTLKI